MQNNQEKHDGRRFAVSDIHGCYEAFMKILKDIDFNDTDTMYIIGDMIDRGPETMKVIEYIREHQNMIPMMGNHEWMLLQFIDGGEYAGSWDLNGNKEMKSWLIKKRDENIEECKELVNWIRKLPYWINLDDYILIHAGWNPGGIKEEIPDEKTEAFLKKVPEMQAVWSRKEFYMAENVWIRKKIIFGHTPTNIIKTRMGEETNPSDAEVLFLGNKIAIDCGCVFGGKLACINLDTMEAIYEEEDSVQKSDYLEKAYLSSLDPDEVVKQFLKNLLEESESLTDEDKDMILENLLEKIKKDDEFVYEKKDLMIRVSAKNDPDEVILIPYTLDCRIQYQGKDISFTELVFHHQTLMEKYREISGIIAQIRNENETEEENSIPCV